MDRPNADAHNTQQAEEPLYICRHCRSEMVFPLDWAEWGKTSFRMTLRCPDCEQIHTVVAPQNEVALLDNELDRGAAELRGDLRAITSANMREEADFFIRALEADIITPDDF